MTDLLFKTKGAYSFQACREWEESGCLHGFIGKSGNFSSRAVSQELPGFLDAFGAQSLVLLEQQHGSVCLDLRDGSSAATPADAMIVRRPSPQFRGIAYGIKTADCLPILVRGAESVALIHAGWRGLACGVLENALAHFEPGKKIEVVMGPAASQARYEVGTEVIEALGTNAIAAPHPAIPEKFFLSLQGTARKIILKDHPAATIWSSDLCTIADNRFHSYRRDGSSFGSNLAFVLC